MDINKKSKCPYTALPKVPTVKIDVYDVDRERYIKYITALRKSIANYEYLQFEACRLFWKHN